MARFLTYARRRWQMLLVVLFLTWRLSRDEFGSRPVMWIAVSLAIVGLVMNLVVMLVNRGMPARVRLEEIPEDQRLDYHPIGPSTRLRFLSDWIPVGNLLISPGDIVLFLAIIILLFGLTG